MKTKNDPINLNDLYKPMAYMKNTSNFSFYMDTIFVVTVLCSYYICCFYINEDIQQGQNYKIIYLHVPCAWISLILYVVVSILSIIYILYSNPIAKILSKCTALVGTLYTLLTLLTGSLWGLPVWGTYWVWDARLTSMFVLFLFYLSYLVSESSFSSIKNYSKMPSMIAILGAINIPIVKFSVEWWNTLHQGSSISQTSSSLYPSISIMLFLVFSILLLFAVNRVIILARKEILSRKSDSIDLSK